MQMRGKFCFRRSWGENWVVDWDFYQKIKRNGRKKFEFNLLRLKKCRQKNFAYGNSRNFFDSPHDIFQLIYITKTELTIVTVPFFFLDHLHWSNEIKIPKDTVFLSHKWYLHAHTHTQDRNNIKNLRNNVFVFTHMIIW